MQSSKKVELIFARQINHGILENVLGYLLAQASIPTNKIFKNAISTPFKLNKIEFTALVLIKSNQDLTMKNLVDVLNIPASNLSLILDKLGNQNLIYKEKSKTDQRLQLLKLTEKGIELTLELEKTSQRMEAELLSALTHAEQSMLIELLKKITKKRKI